MKATSRKDLIDIIIEEVDAYANTLKPKAKYRRCFYCDEPFKLTNKGRVYCSPRCGRSAHYLRFNIKQLIKRG